MQAQLTQVEAAAAAARDKAVAQGLSDRMGALETQPSAVRLLLANHKLREAKTAKVWPQGGVRMLGQRWGRWRRRGCCVLQTRKCESHQASHVNSLASTHCRE